jgi:peptidoglycan/LPS O-acetylase OafA/YrhL
MKPSFRLIGTIILVVGCILLGLGFYLLFYNWYYEEANNIYLIGNLCIISSFILNVGIALFKIRKNQYPKKVLSLFPLGFALGLLGLIILAISPESFWLFLLFVISGIVTFFVIVYYEHSHPEKFKQISTNSTLQK